MRAVAIIIIAASLVATGADHAKTQEDDPIRRYVDAETKALREYIDLKFNTATQIHEEILQRLLNNARLDLKDSRLSARTDSLLLIHTKILGSVSDRVTRNFNMVVENDSLLLITLKSLLRTDLNLIDRVMRLEAASRK